MLLMSQKVISGMMRSYQLQGLNWMVSLHHNGLNGMLADKLTRIFLSLYPTTAHPFSSRVSVKPSK